MHSVTLGKLLNLCKLLFPLLSNFRTEKYQIEKYLVFHLTQHVYFVHLETEDSTGFSFLLLFSCVF